MKLLVILVAGAILIAFLVCALCLDNILLYIPFGIVFVLFLPYIISFYLLENRFQKLSNLYFKLNSFTARFFILSNIVSNSSYISVVIALTPKLSDTFSEI